MAINQAAPKFQDASIAPMHTTEHIVNRTMVNLFGCERAVSAHIERKKSKLDFALPTCPTKEENSTLYNVQLLTEKLTRKDNTIGLLFNDPTFYQNLSTTTANAASLLEDLKAHPKRYVHFSLFGKKDK